jgi:hypothetical protein
MTKRPQAENSSSILYDMEEETTYLLFYCGQPKYPLKNKELIKEWIKVQCYRRRCCIRSLNSPESIIPTRHNT